MGVVIKIARLGHVQGEKISTIHILNIISTNCYLNSCSIILVVKCEGYHKDKAIRVVAGVASGSFRAAVHAMVQCGASRDVSSALVLAGCTGQAVAEIRVLTLLHIVVLAILCG